MWIRAAAVSAIVAGATALIVFSLSTAPSTPRWSALVRTSRVTTRAHPPADARRILASNLFAPSPHVIDHRTPSRSLYLVDVGARVVLVDTAGRSVLRPCETPPQAIPASAPPARVTRLASTHFAVAPEVVDGLRTGAIPVRARLFPTGRGFRIAAVRQGSVEAELGLESGDEILSVDGRPATDTAAMLDLARSIAAGMTVKVTLDRRGRTREITYTL